MPAININRWMASQLDALQFNRQRQLVVLQGPRAWCDEGLAAVSSLDPALHLLSNRDLLPSAIPFSKADSCLGSETRLVAVDLFAGFNPDVLCIAGGLVRAGGVLLLLSPGSDDWDLQVDRYARWQDGKRSSHPFFVEYFFDALRHDPQIGVILTPDSTPPPLAALAALRPTPIENGETPEQSAILRQIERWAGGSGDGVALISADRGRGKSTCLGQLVNRLQARFRILVSANSRRNAAALLQRAPQAEFVAPDHLLRDCPEAELLLIDEAAMIPLSMLRQLVRLYPRLVMVTTSGGYEGTGRGFMLRFVASLEAGNLVHYRLERPVRWCRDDRLEAWLNRTLLAEPDMDRTDRTQVSVSDCEIEVLNEPAGAGSWPLLRQVYALLNSAHYRTRPSDLRMLMENPDLVLVVAHRRACILGVALLNHEGGLDASLCEEVFLGQRRPQGHLLAQMLTAQAGLREFGRYRGLRVQRIAVAGGCRRQGLGTRLIERAMQYCHDHSLAYLGASFALEPETSNFWRRVRFSLVHVCYAPGKASGSHSIAVLKPIASELVSDIDRLQARLQQQLPVWMTQFLQTMDAAEVIALLRFADYRASMGLLERHDIEAFAEGNRGFEICFASLQKYVMQRIAQTSGGIDRLLIEKAVQNRAWKLLERESGSEGRKQLQQRLRAQVDALRKAC